MKRALWIIGHLVFAAVVLTGCESASQSSEGLGGSSGPGRSEPAISEAMESAVASFNRGAGLLEQYKFSAAAKAFEKVLEVVPDWTAARYNLGLGGRIAIKRRSSSCPVLPGTVLSTPRRN